MIFKICRDNNWYCSLVWFQNYKNFIYKTTINTWQKIISTIFTVLELPNIRHFGISAFHKTLQKQL